MLERWFTFPPTISVAEVAVVTATVLYLFLTPAVLALLDARRRRADRARFAAPIPAFESSTAAASMAAADLQPLPSAEAEPAWPIDAPSAPPVWDENEPLPPPLTTELPPETNVSAAAPATRTEEAAMNLAFPIPSDAPRADASEPQPSATPTVPQIPAASETAPQIAAPQPPPAAPAPQLSDDVPVLRLDSFPEPPPQPSWKYSCQLIELRQARLPQWPPDSVRKDPQREQLWEQGERLAASFDRALSTTRLSVPAMMQATALGGVESDGRLLRLHFLLFDDLWPTAPNQATAQAVFEIDPAGGPLRSWVQPR